VGAVVVFMGSWVASLAGWGNTGWLLVTLGGVALALPLLLRGVVISARASFIMFCSEALGLIVLSVVVFARAHSHLGAPLHPAGGTPGGLHGLVGLTFALAVSGFVGWENSGALAEESKDPKRYIPITVFSSIIIITGLYVLSSWAAVAGFADWKGAVAGVNLLGNPAVEVTPFLDLSRHFSPWFDWFIALVGFTSSFGCFIAAANSQTRITFNGARAGLLPPPMAAVSRTKVPWASVLIYTGLLVVLVVVPYFRAARQRGGDLLRRGGHRHRADPDRLPAREHRPAAARARHQPGRVPPGQARAHPADRLGRAGLRRLRVRPAGPAAAGQRVLGLDTRYRARRRGGDGHRLPPAAGRAAAGGHGRAGVHRGGRMTAGAAGRAGDAG
jgi:hypothetical protein